MSRVIALSLLLLLLACTSPPSGPSADRAIDEAPVTTAPGSTPTPPPVAPPGSQLELARRYAQDAQRLCDQGQVEEALSMLRTAERAAPEDPVVLEVSRNVRSLLGVRRPGASSLMEDSLARDRIRQQMIQELVRMELDRCRKAIAAKDFVAAHDHAQSARTIMRRHPEVSWSEIDIEVAKLGEEIARANPER